jgi:hypothetical protein
MLKRPLDSHTIIFLPFLFMGGPHVYRWLEVGCSYFQARSGPMWEGQLPRAHDRWGHMSLYIQDNLIVHFWTHYSLPDGKEHIMRDCFLSRSHARRIWNHSIDTSCDGFAAADQFCCLSIPCLSMKHGMLVQCFKCIYDEFGMPLVVSYEAYKDSSLRRESASSCKLGEFLCHYMVPSWLVGWLIRSVGTKAIRKTLQGPKCIFFSQGCLSKGMYFITFLCIICEIKPNFLYFLPCFIY